MNEKDDKSSNLDWKLIRAEYLSTDISLKRLATKYGISKNTLLPRAAREGWADTKNRINAKITAAVIPRIIEQKAQDQLDIYEMYRQTALNFATALLEASKDPNTLHRHLVQVEDERQSSVRAYDGMPGTKETVKRKWVEDKIADTINGRNVADMARSIKDLAGVMRILDNKIDAPDQAKLDLDREKMELSKRQAGMGDDIEAESGIALLPAVDDSLLENALPDPDQVNEAAK